MIWLPLIKRHLRRLDTTDAAPTEEDIRGAVSILFAVFARYGDSVIAFRAIYRFMGHYPGKQYRLITTHQALPYAQALVHHPARLVGVNKRRDPLTMWRLVHELKRCPPDLGFNPWSDGEESEFFISFCRRFVPYRALSHIGPERNLHERVRRYLRLPDPIALALPRLPTRAARVVVCPFSTDVRKSLDIVDLEKLLRAVPNRFVNPTIVIAGTRQELARAALLSVPTFELDKSRAASERFVALLRAADVVVAVDGGPLHVADALGIPTIGLFGPTAPETILDRERCTLPLRHPAMDGVFCGITQCTDPVCLHRLCDTLELDRAISFDADRSLRMECTRCAMEESAGKRRGSMITEPHALATEFSLLRR
jgi:hypothetical protein